MKTSQLLLSGLDITEDAYNFEAQFILSISDKSRSVDIGDLDLEAKLREIKEFFNLEETPLEIRSQLMELIMEKANISSSIIEGNDYEETIKAKRVERRAKNYDMA
ncbi:MAG: hypothetical protein ABFD25_02535 [Clostridiaceae bacterium]